MKKVLCMVLALILCLGLLAGCGGSKETAEEVEQDAAEVSAAKMEAFENKEETKVDVAQAAEAEGKEVRYAEELVRLMKDKVNDITPINLSGRCMLMGEVWNMVYDTFLIMSSDLQTYSPGLATEWDTEDYQTFHFKLREGVKFHNGEIFDVDDVLYTYEAGMEEEAVGSGLTSRCMQIEKIDVVNDYEFYMVLKQPNFDWWYDMANILAFPLVNRTACEADRDVGAMVGTGPWKVVEHSSSDYIVFERNDDYWGEVPKTKKITFRYISETTARNIMIQNGEADSSVLDEADIPTYENDPNYTIDFAFNCSTGYLSFNTRRPNTSDLNFRLACAYCFNVQEMIDIALNGYGKVHESGSLWGLNAAYANPNLPKFEQDIEKAKEYLAKSNYDGSPVELVATMSYTSQVAQVAMVQMQAIGINAVVTSVDNGTLSQRGRWDNNDIDMLVLQQMMGALGKDMNVAIQDNANDNKAQWVNEEVQQLIEKTIHEPNGEERQADYYRIQELMYEELPYFPTYHVGIWAVGRAGLGGLDMWPTGNNDLSQMYRVLGDDE